MVDRASLFSIKKEPRTIYYSLMYKGTKLIKSGLTLSTATNLMEEMIMNITMDDMAGESVWEPAKKMLKESDDAPW